MLRVYPGDGKCGWPFAERGRVSTASLGGGIQGGQEARTGRAERKEG